MAHFILVFFVVFSLFSLGVSICILYTYTDTAEQLEFFCVFGCI